MFKVGDIVRLSDIGRDIYKTKLYRQTYVVTWSGSKYGMIKVKGFVNSLEICYSNHIVEIDYDYLRKQKLNKICSKLEMC